MVEHRSVGHTWPVAVQLLEERRFDPPRHVEVEHNGAWWPAFQFAWRRCDDTRGWMADVEWAERYDRGLRKHVTMVPPERLRPTV
jgi:hypothetical protein